jgi:DNA-binding GntR family transcriptional regulator
MKGNTVFKAAYNRCLTLLEEMEPGVGLPSISELATKLSVSRTTVRSVLSALVDGGILHRMDESFEIAKRPQSDDYFPEKQTISAGAAVERRFMEWILQGDFRAGQLLNSAELARQFGTSTTTIREYLTHFQRFGLIERRPNSAWVFLGITTNFAAEIYEVRQMFELRSARHLVAASDGDQRWKELDRIEAQHLVLLSDIDNRYKEFPVLDERFHRFVHEASGNRYIIEFYDVFSTLFHYTYQWNRDDEKQRNARALVEHLDYITALKSRDLSCIDDTFTKHLQTAQATLLRSIKHGPFRVADATD